MVPGACSASWEDPSAPSGLSPELPVRSTTTTVTLSLHRQPGSSEACLTELISALLHSLPKKAGQQPKRITRAGASAVHAWLPASSRMQLSGGLAHTRTCHERPGEHRSHAEGANGSQRPQQAAEGSEQLRDNTAADCLKHQALIQASERVTAQQQRAQAAGCSCTWSLDRWLHG